MEPAVTTEAEACAILAQHVGVLPPGHRFAGGPVDGTVLWWVQAFDDSGFPYAGAGYRVGPDGQLWVFSSNPGIHDSDLLEEALHTAPAPTNLLQPVGHVRLPATSSIHWPAVDPRRPNMLQPGRHGRLCATSSIHWPAVGAWVPPVRGGQVPIPRERRRDRRSGRPAHH